MRPTLVLIALIVLCLGAGGLGQLFTGPSALDWYHTMERPSWNPPDWVFAPVWTFLYLAMAVAAWLVWHKAGWYGARGPLILFAVQLALNAVWTILFFGQRMPGLAFLELVVLWAVILMTLITFWRIRPMAGALLVPYLVWVTFASVLNYSIWQMNA
ncbi:MAG: tryptophan-rich sensory protein [Planctomycetota bacterium]|nr:tryptophan-rich sensory protein [Planctomycetota bacterium]